MNGQNERVQSDFNALCAALERLSNGVRLTLSKNGRKWEIKAATVSPHNLKGDRSRVVFKGGTQQTIQFMEGAWCMFDVMDIAERKG